MSWEFIFAQYSANSLDLPPDRKFVPTCDSPDDVKIYISPWVSNAFAIQNLGPISIILNGDYPLDEGLELLEKKCRENAFYIGANAIINFTCEIHLWEKPVQFHADGSRCVLKFQV